LASGVENNLSSTSGGQEIKETNEKRAFLPAPVHLNVLWVNILKTIGWQI
jgi:hypothetical protein